MAYLEDLHKFYANFALWRMKTLGLEYRYLLLLSNSRNMSDIFPEIVEAASDFVNNTHIRDESQILGSVWFFNNFVGVQKNSFSERKDTILNYLYPPPVCQGSTNLWSAVEDSLKMVSASGNERQKMQMLVFTDGYDIEGDFGEREIISHNQDGIEKIVELAETKRIKVHFLAYVREDRDSLLWRILARRANEKQARVKWVNIIQDADISNITARFKDHYSQAQTDILTISTLDNFRLRFLRKNFPAPRWYLYPGLLLCMYLEEITEQEYNSHLSDELSFSLIGLKATLKKFIEGIVDNELYKSATQQVIKAGDKFDQEQKDQYLNWINQTNFIEKYLNLILETMQLAGWIHHVGGDTWVIRRPSEPTSVVILELMNRYFLTDIWNEPQELDPKQRPKLMGLMKKIFRGPPQPCLPDREIRELWPLD